MSRGMLARVVLAAAVATCAVGAVLAVVLLTGARGPTAPGAAPAAPDPAAALAVGPGERVTVIRVVDAVTFDARLPGGRSVVRVRALGVQPPGDCYGAESTAVAQQVLGGKAVRLMGEGPQPATDAFDRRLASATLDQGDYAVLAAEAGIARVYTAGAPEARMPPIREAQARAREAGRGVWGPPCLGAAAAPAPATDTPIDTPTDPSASSESPSSPDSLSAGSSSSDAAG